MNGIGAPTDIDSRKGEQAIAVQMTIFDVPGLGTACAYAEVQRTLSKHHRLRDIYDDEFIQRLVRRRRGQNYLLFMLVQPENEVTDHYWASVVADLVSLEGDHSFQRFKPKLRARDCETLEAGRSELALAARLKQLGYDIELEAPTRNGRDCDFVASTEPATCWEIKAVLDLDSVVQDAQSSFEIQTRLRRIDEPYILSILHSKIATNDVAAAVRDIKRQIAAHYRVKGALPMRFVSMGLVVEASRLTKHPNGYIGTSFLGGRIFGTEHSKKIRDRISSAVDQLPEDRPGVVVIDTTTASWVDQEDVIDACFGAESFCYASGQILHVRDSEAAAFQPLQRTRVSAVVHYTRHPGDNGQSLLVIHNPFARVPLHLETLAAPDVQQMHRVEPEPGCFLLRKTPPDPVV